MAAEEPTPAFKYDPERDEVVQTVHSTVHAPDIAEGKRTKHMGAHDEIRNRETDILTLENLSEELGNIPGRDGRIAQLELEIAASESEITLHRRARNDAAERFRELEFHAPRERRWKRRSEWLLVPLLALGEAALAFVGFRLATPSLGAAAGDPVLKLIVEHGAELAAVAVGVAGACLQIAVGHELALSSRAVLTDPMSTVATGENDG